MGPAISHYVDRIILSIEMCFDQRKCRKKKRYPTAQETQRRTMGEYWDKYVGPEYVIENAQANLLNFTMTCFLFGAGLPVLFPVTLLCLIVLYVFEKKTIARLARLPKNFNPYMND